MNSKLESILSRLPKEIRNEITVKPLLGGMTNQSYLIERDRETFVLRIFGEGTEQLGINRNSERICTELAAKIGIGAEVVPWIPGNDILVTRFIAGMPLTVEMASEPKMMQRIVRSIQCCHEGPSFPGHFSAFKDIQTYYRLATQYQVSLPGLQSDTFEQLAQIEAVLKPITRSKSCHNDLLAGNLIDDGETIRIIDWEYGAMGDPFFDLGFFATDNQLDDEQCEQLLHNYFGEVRVQDVAHLHLMRLVSDLRETFCPLLLSAISQIDIDYITYASQHYDRYRREVMTPRFRQWLEQVT